MNKLLLCSLLVIGTSHADLMTNFDTGSLPAGLGLDVPDAGLASITLNTGTQELDLTTTGNTDMWANRVNAPIAWTARPVVTAGQTWYAETEMRYNGAADGLQRVAGLLIYPDADGVGGSNGGMDFSLGINDWDNRGVEVQGFGDNIPQLTSASGPVSQAHLRMHVTENGLTDHYDFFFKLNAGDAWTNFAQHDSGVDNSRVGLFLKNGTATAPADRSVSFTYFNVGVIPEPSTMSLFAVGAILLMRRRRRS